MLTAWTRSRTSRWPTKIRLKREFNLLGVLCTISFSCRVQEWMYGAISPSTFPHIFDSQAIRFLDRMDGASFRRFR